MTLTDKTLKRSIRADYSDKLWSVLACPECLAKLARADARAQCTGCGALYQRLDSGALDLRLPRVKSFLFSCELGKNPLPDYPVNCEPLTQNPKPQVDFSEIELPHNISTNMSSYFPRAHTGSSLMLDLGCGEPIYQGMVEHAGFEYVGLDFGAPDAPLVGDAQALPFRDECFELIWSNAVLQYVPYPGAMMSEAYRVLQPGGMIMGTAGFMEPFDGGSFFMPTQLGIVHLLHQSGFKVLRVAPDAWWTGLVAMSRMGLFPRMPATVSRALVLPLEAVSKLWWRFGLPKRNDNAESLRLVRITGAHEFIAVKS